MVIKFLIENREIINTCSIVLYASILVFAIIVLIASKIEEHKQTKEQTRMNQIKANEYRKAIVSKQVKAIMNCDL